jgi:hypothetical protein
MVVGYLTHLTLDELYSVDVMDTRIKASFGTALKLIDLKHPGQTGVMVAAAIGAFLLAPSSKPFIDSVASRPVWLALQTRLLPHDRWFGMDWRGTAWLPGKAPDVAPAATTGTSAISTGSIEKAPEGVPKQ